MMEFGRNQNGRMVWTVLASLALASGYFDTAALAQRRARPGVFGGGIQGGVDPSVANEGSESVFYPPDRATMQRFSTAQEMLKEQRFGEAARLLGGILEVPEDYFFQPDREAPVYRSLKSEARRLIGEMPAAGKESYELQYGAQARKMLSEAIAKGDADALAAVSRQFFHTQAGYEATYLLGDSEMGHGRPLAAALCLRRLQETSRAAAPFEPTLSLKIAVCWLRSGMPSQAAAALVRLKREAPETEFKINGKPRKLFANDSQALGWLAEIAGEMVHDEGLGPDQWTMYRGGPNRNSASPGSSPLLNRRWATPTANDPQLEKQLADIQEQHLEQGGRMTPGLHPLAVNGYVFMRSVNCLEAIDFRTGKRIWNGPVDEHVENMLRQSSALAASGGIGSPTWLEQRVWDDATYGTLSSDGVRVYCVEDLAGNMQETVPGAIPGRQQVMIVNNGRVVTPNTISYNRLAAYEIATEGKLSWPSLGGEPKDDGDSRLAGAFFLGPPLPLGGRLYVLAEMKGEIRLLALEAETGDVVWSQQIAVVERSILEDPLRRIAGATPSYSDGVLVCPTSAGAVVAVDLTTRALLWGYQYPRAIDPSYQNRMFQFRFGGLPVNDASENDRWTDASVTIAEGRVLLTPLESPKIHCLNLLDGKLEWQEDRGNGIYVACVHDGKALIVDNREVRALKLADGKPAWKDAALPLPSGSMPSGRGFFDGERYFLPLTSAEVAAIDVATGKIVGRSRSRSGAVPGNLICYQGAVISQGIDHLECFYQLEDLRKQVAATLKEHPDDPQAMARRGELLLDEGKLEEAVGDLRRSYQLQPDPRTRELLVDALLEGLRVDFARRRQDAEEIERLAEQPAERARYQRLMAVGLQQAGESLAAFEAYLRMTDLKNPSNELERVEHALSVRRDRWIRARLTALWEAASPADRETIRARLHSMLEEIQSDGAPDVLRAFISYFDPFPEADEAREALVARLLSGDSSLEAEQLLRRLATSDEAARARAATARLAQLLLNTSRYADAAIHCRVLQDQWADVACLDGKTGRQLVEEMAMIDLLKRQLAGPVAWPEGEVEKHAEASVAMPTNRGAIEFRGPTGPYFEHMILESDQQQGALLGRDSLGREAWRVALHERGGMNPMGFSPAINHVRVDGHFLLASLGHQLVAIDTLATPAKGGPRVLWRQDLGDGSGLTRQTTIRAVNMPWGMPRVQAIDLHGRPIGNTGPLGDDFVCFQRLRNLAVVHPLTGTNLWVRNDVPAGSEIFGDESLLFVVPPNAHEALVYRTVDGQEMGRRALPSFEQRIVALGRLVLAWTMGEGGGKASLKLVDPWEQKELWRREFDANARFSCLGEEAIGVLERSGKYVLLDLPSGQAKIEAEVAPEPSLSEIYILRSATRELLVTNRPWQHRNNFNVMAMQSPGGVVIDGMIHGFDRQSGKKVYSTRLEHKGLSVSQPYDLPILTFAANIQPQMRNVNTPHGNVMCLDKRNGRVIYEEDLPQPIGSVDVTSDVDKHEVTVRTMKSSKRLVFTDRPLPPAPADEKKDKPKTTDSTSRRAGRAVLRGFRKWAGDLKDALPIESPAAEEKAAAAK